MFTFVGPLKEARAWRYQFCSCLSLPYNKYQWQALRPYSVHGDKRQARLSIPIDMRLSTGHILRGDLAGLPPGWINVLWVNTRLLRILICEKKNYFLPLFSSRLKQINDAHFWWSFIFTRNVAIYGKRNFFK